MHDLPTSPIDRLPTELVLDVMGRLPSTDLKKLVRTSKRYRLIGGPAVYCSQKVPDVDHLVRLSVLAGQPDVAAMITYVESTTPILRSEVLIKRPFTAVTWTLTLSRWNIGGSVYRTS